MSAKEFRQLFLSFSNMLAFNTRSTQNGNLKLSKIELKCAKGSISYFGALFWNIILSEARKENNLASV